jgi:hypothetical protein
MCVQGEGTHAQERAVATVTESNGIAADTLAEHGEESLTGVFVRVAARGLG